MATGIAVAAAVGVDGAVGAGDVGATGKSTARPSSVRRKRKKQTATRSAGMSPKIWSTTSRAR
jgi:hypothetical protein